MTAGQVLVTLALLAKMNGLCPDFAQCIVYHESRYDMSARGAAGEIGAGQIMPTTGAWLAEQARNDPTWRHPVPEPLDLSDPYTNLMLTVYGLQRWPRWWSTLRLCEGGQR